MYIFLIFHFKIGAHQQYVFGVLKSCIEIRNIKSGLNVQTLDIQDVISSSISNFIYVANPTMIWILEIRSVDDQVSQLLSSRLFEEAKALISMSDKPDFEKVFIIAYSRWIKLDQFILPLPIIFLETHKCARRLHYWKKSSLRQKQLWGLFLIFWMIIYPP